MNDPESARQLLLKYADGRIENADELARVEEMLRGDAESRRFIRAMAEHAVAVADVERTDRSRKDWLSPRHRDAVKPASRPRRMLIATAVLCVTTVLAFRLLPGREPGVKVSMVTGAVQLFGARGGYEKPLLGESILSGGDTIETRSCDAWISLGFPGGPSLTVAGHSVVRLLQTDSGVPGVRLVHGNLWVVPREGEGGGSLLIRTPTMIVDTQDAQLDVQSSESDTLVRVNEGVARYSRVGDDRMIEIGSGRQITASLGRSGPIEVVPQPRPVKHWNCELASLPDVILGKWLPPAAGERARLGAEPLLWPIPDHDPITLHAVAISVWDSSKSPVLLKSDSVVRIRGRTDSSHTVRFGFSTQRMQGVFAGKFEVDVPPDQLGLVGETWEIELPVSAFKPIQPGLPAFPDGLEMTDIYALTVIDDAGLEINHIELLPGTADVE